METVNQKHPCPDCHHCQWCSDDRCHLCLKSTNNSHRKLSMAEQIVLFEQLNNKQRSNVQEASVTQRED